MNPKYPFQTYPTKIAEPHIRVEGSDTPAERHKALLDLGESLLLYILGVMFGEYKGSGKIDKKIEADFYLSSKSKASLGVYVKYLRDHLVRILDDSILRDRLTTPYPKVGELGFVWFTLKNLVEKKGVTGDFSEAVANEVGDKPQFPERLLTSSNKPKKNPGGFFDILVAIRNKHAHPGEWPLGDDYFEFINPYLHSALTEIILGLEILKDYRSLLVKNINDEKKQGTFEVEMTNIPSDLKLNLNREQLSMVTTDLRYLFDQDDQLLFKFYYNSIPQVNPEVAKEIINAIRRKEMEPILKETIRFKLDDGVIDEMELLILKDNANTASISEERLFQLIESVKSKMQQEFPELKDKKVGTPDNPGDIFIEVKDDKGKPTFNIWWLYYFNMVNKINPAIVKKEQANSKVYDQKINKIRSQKKSLTIKKQIVNIAKKLRDRKALKSKQLKSFNQKIKLKREQRKKATILESKVALLQEVKSLQEKAEEKKVVFDQQIQEIVSKQYELESIKMEKERELDENIKSLITDKNVSQVYKQWGIHRNLWNEINNYVDYIIELYLNTGKSQEEDEGGSTELKWVNSPNAWQIGALSYTYWAKLYPEQSPLGIAYNVGFAVSGRFKWLKSKHPSIKDKIAKPCVLTWPTTDDDTVAKIDLDGRLTDKCIELRRQLVSDYKKELTKLGATVSCIDESGYIGGIPIEEYIRNETEYRKWYDEKTAGADVITKLEGFGIFSSIWNITDFMDDGNFSFEKMNKFEKEIATFIQLFRNIVIKLNDYALEIGINEETIKQSRDTITRLQNVIFDEFEKLYVPGKSFTLSPDDNKRLLNYANEVGLSDYLFTKLISDFRFGKSWDEKQKGETT